jgi:signal transduction histidine kinase
MMSDAPHAEPAAPRRWRPLRSVRLQILASMLAVAAAGMLIAGTTAFFVQRASILSSIETRLTDAVPDVSFIALDSGATELEGVLTAVVQRVRPGTGESTFALTDAGSAIIPGGQIDFRLEQDSEFVDRIRAETANRDVVTGTAATSNRAVRYVAVPISMEGSGGTGVVVFAVDVDAALAPINDAFRTFALVAAGALALVALVGWFVSGRLLAPIRRLRETAARITASDVSERIVVTGTDDISDLAVTVNGMLDRLEGALTGQRQLLDDVGHELKTPITIVRGHLELMNAGSPTDVVDTRAIALDELDRMSSLVRDISDLAQSQRPMTLSLEPTDIAALTERARTKASALSRNVTWSVRQTADVTAQVDPDRLTQALLQLASNAVSHAGSSATVELGSTVRGDRLYLWVRDDGPGIDLDLQKVIFERFRRGAVGRGTSGSGLGLAIVAVIAQAHGGVARVDSRPGHGATFFIDIPLVPSEPGGADQ